MHNKKLEKDYKNTILMLRDKIAAKDREIEELKQDLIRLLDAVENITIRSIKGQLVVLTERMDGLKCLASEIRKELEDE